MQNVPLTSIPLLLISSGCDLFPKPAKEFFPGQAGGPPQAKFRVGERSEQEAPKKTLYSTKRFYGIPFCSLISIEMLLVSSCADFEASCSRCALTQSLTLASDSPVDRVEPHHFKWYGWK